MKSKGILKADGELACSFDIAVTLVGL